MMRTCADAIQCSRSCPGFGVRGGFLLRRGSVLRDLVFASVVLGAVGAVAAGMFAYTTQRKWMRHTRERATWASLCTIKTALATYAGFNDGAVPTSLEALKQGALAPLPVEAKLNDAWRNPFVYAPVPLDNERRYTLVSTGPDGRLGTADDLDVWKEPAE